MEKWPHDLEPHTTHSTWQDLGQALALNQNRNRLVQNKFFLFCFCFDSVYRSCSSPYSCISSSQAQSLVILCVFALILFLFQLLCLCLIMVALHFSEPILYLGADLLFQSLQSSFFCWAVVLLISFISDDLSSS